LGKLSPSNYQSGTDENCKPEYSRPKPPPEHFDQPGEITTGCARTRCSSTVARQSASGLLVRGRVDRGRRQTLPGCLRWSQLRFSLVKPPDYVPRTRLGKPSDYSLRTERVSAISRASWAGHVLYIAPVIELGAKGPIYVFYSIW
jgi:hypothetical protein